MNYHVQSFVIKWELKKCENWKETIFWLKRFLLVAILNRQCFINVIKDKIKRYLGLVYEQHNNWFKNLWVILKEMKEQIFKVVLTYYNNYSHQYIVKNNLWQYRFVDSQWQCDTLNQSSSHLFLGSFQWFDKKKRNKEIRTLFHIFKIKRKKAGRKSMWRVIGEKKEKLNSLP